EATGLTDGSEVECVVAVPDVVALAVALGVAVAGRPELGAPDPTGHETRSVAAVDRLRGRRWCVKGQRDRDGVSAPTGTRSEQVHPWARRVEHAELVERIAARIGDRVVLHRPRVHQADGLVLEHAHSGELARELV